jgi:hypothetical protein
MSPLRTSRRCPHSGQRSSTDRPQLHLETNDGGKPDHRLKGGVAALRGEQPSHRLLRRTRLPRQIGLGQPRTPARSVQLPHQRIHSIDFGARRLVRLSERRIVHPRPNILLEPGLPTLSRRHEP